MPTEQFSVAGASTIVTGASSGIGKTIANQFAADGANVAICSRDQAACDAVAADINERDGGEAIAIECDVRDRGAMDDLVDVTVDAFGGLDVMVNNAGASFMAPVEEISENGWKTIVDINLHGTFNGCQAAGNVMRDDGGGIILNFSSRGGLELAPMMSHYGASKAAVIHFTKTLAFEWAPYGIRVNCIAPGFVATPGTASQMGIEPGAVDRTEVNRRVGSTEEIADVAQFLASAAASYVNGETIVPRGAPRFAESTAGDVADAVDFPEPP